MSNHIGYRPTWAEIKLSNIDHNFAQVKKTLAHGVKVMVTVKADAYGHGLVPVSKRLCGCGADYLGVASIDEAIKLRQAGIKLPILVLGIVLDDHIDPLFKYNLTATACSREFAACLNRRARALGKTANIHIKVDTGMGRIGAMHDEAYSIVKAIQKLKHINIEGIFTHFAFADIDKKFTLYQIDIFDRLVNNLKKEGINIPLVHAANSAGIINYQSGHFNMVRPGLVIYGLYPSDKINIRLKPVLSLKTRVVYVKKMPGGSGISYGHTYFTKRNTTVVTLPIGYGDGYPRNLSNQAPVLIRGRRFKISGRVCMDQMMVDVADALVRVGDEVVLIGRQRNQRITTEELANLSATIPYEIVCGLGSRIPRVYV